MSNVHLPAHFFVCVSRIHFFRGNVSIYKKVEPYKVCFRPQEITSTVHTFVGLHKVVSWLARHFSLQLGRLPATHGNHASIPIPVKSLIVNHIWWWMKSTSRAFTWFSNVTTGKSSISFDAFPSERNLHVDRNKPSDVSPKVFSRLYGISLGLLPRLPYSNQTWRWKMDHLSVMFPASNLHLVLGFSSQPCLMTPEGSHLHFPMDFPIVFLWCSHLPMVFLGKNPIFPWCSHGFSHFPVGFLGFPKRFPPAYHSYTTATTARLPVASAVAEVLQESHLRSTIHPRGVVMWKIIILWIDNDNDPIIMPNDH